MRYAKCPRPLVVLAALALAPGRASAQVIDSILPPEVELARFRATVPGSAPTALAGATSRAELIRRFVASVETSDAPALGRLVLSKAEFAYLYFQSSEYSKPPYRQNPALVWFRMTEISQKGIGRVLARDGGQPLAAIRHRCPNPPKLEGANRIWSGCRLVVRKEAKTLERQLFGSIIERHGQFKFLTYATEY